MVRIYGLGLHLAAGGLDLPPALASGRVHDGGPMPLRKPESPNLLNTDRLSADLAMMDAPFLTVSGPAEEFLCLRAQLAIAGL